MSDIVAVESLPTGLINRLNNGAFILNPEGTASGADGSTCFQSWTRLSQTASIQTSQLTTPEAGQSRGIRLTQTNATAQRMGLCQTIPAVDCSDLRTFPLTLSGQLRFSVQNARTMYAVLEYDGAADTSPVDPINDWTSTVYAPGQFFKSSFTVLNYGFLSATAGTYASLPYIPIQAGSGLNNLVVVVWTENVVAQNGTLDAGLIQIIKGADALSFEYRPLYAERVFGPQLLMPDGTAAAPSYSFLSDATAGMFYDAATDRPTLSQGVSAFTWSAAGVNYAFGSPGHYDAETINGGDAGEWLSDFRYDADTQKLYLRSIIMAENNDTSELAVRRWNGTYDSPTGVLSGQSIGIIYWQGMDDTGRFQPDGQVSPFYGRSAIMGCIATENLTTTGRGGAWYVSTCENGELVNSFRFWVSQRGFGVFNGREPELPSSNYAPNNVDGWGNVSVVATPIESGDQAAAISIAKRTTNPATAGNTRFDVGFNHTLDRIEFYKVILNNRALIGSIDLSTGFWYFGNNLDILVVDETNDRVYVGTSGGVTGGVGKLQVQSASAPSLTLNRESGGAGDIAEFMYAHTKINALEVNASSLLAWESSMAAPGRYTAQVLLNDDSATSFSPPSTIGLISGEDGGTQFFGAFYRCETVAVCKATGNTDTDVAYTTGPLTGTTGSDGDLTISAADDGRVYIENRLGGARTITYTVWDK